jgi:hypothetical protein
VFWLRIATAMFVEWDLEHGVMTIRRWTPRDGYSLLTRIPHRNLYTLTPDGLRFAVFYTKVHDRVLRPLIAGDQPQAPPPLRAALRVIDGELTRRLAAARLPAAA